MVNSGTGVGVAVAGVATVLAPGSWRSVWAVAAVLALLAATSIDRRTDWSLPVAGHDAVDEPAAAGGLGRPVVAAAVAGLGSAAVWTFGRELLTTTGRLGEGTTALLWVVLGTSAVLGGLSGDLVRVLGLGGAWRATTLATALGTALLVLAPGAAPVAAVGVVLFGGAYTALSGVLVAWAGQVRPAEPGRTTALLFVALTLGQAAGSLATGVLTDRHRRATRVLGRGGRRRPGGGGPAACGSARSAGEGVRECRSGGEGVRECPVGG